MNYMRDSQIVGDFMQNAKILIKSKQEVCRLDALFLYLLNITLTYHLNRAVFQTIFAHLREQKLYLTPLTIK